jgi:hypothetical protein
MEGNFANEEQLEWALSGRESLPGRVNGQVEEEEKQASRLGSSRHLDWYSSEQPLAVNFLNSGDVEPMAPPQYSISGHEISQSDLVGRNDAMIQ